jgi:pyridoxine kinase
MSSAPSGRPPDAVLSIQSAVASGHVGNSAATLPLQRLGFDVFAVNTVLLAHHPGHGRWRGHKVAPAALAEIVDGLVEHGALASCVAVLSGYLGDPAVADVVLRALDAVRGVRPDALYLCDPVIGDDHTGVFVGAGIPERMRDDLVPRADLVLPNRFELAALTGLAVVDLASALAAAAALRARGPRLVVATGLPLPGRPEALGVLAAAEDEAWLVTTPRRPVAFGGTGDAFSALFLGHYLRSGAVGAALERAVAAVFALVERGCELGAKELPLVALQDQLAEPALRFAAERIAARRG